MSSPGKKLTSFNDDVNKQGVGEGGIGSNKNQSLDEFFSTRKEGPLKLEDDVSVDSSMDDNIREIITSNRKLNSDELLKHNADLYKWLVKRAGIVLKRKGRGYDKLAKMYHKKRMQDPEYVELNTVHDLGQQGQITEINNETADTSWRASVRLHGPAFRRRREIYMKHRPPKVVYQVSAQEEARVAAEKENIKHFNRFLVNQKLIARGLPPEWPETRLERAAREAKEWEEEKIVARAQGDFKKIRPSIDALQLQASLVDWDYGIYRIWDILKHPLPGVGNRPEVDKAKRGVIKVESDYSKNALVNLHSGSIFHKMEGDVEEHYQEYYRNRKLAAAELYVLEGKIKAAQEALEEQKQRDRIMEELHDGDGFFGRNKLSKAEKALREQLFQKAVDRQIWRGKGSSKDVAKQIFQDIKKLEIEQRKEKSELLDSGDTDIEPNTATSTAPCLPTCFSLQLARENHFIRLQRRWWSAKGHIKSSQFKRQLNRKKEKSTKRKQHKNSAILPATQLANIRDDVQPIDGPLECGDEETQEREVSVDIIERTQENEDTDPIHTDAALIVGLQTATDQNTTLKGLLAENINNDIPPTSNSGSDIKDSEIPTDIQPEDLELPLPDITTPIPSPSRLTRLTMTAFSPLKFISMQKGNMTKGVRSSKIDTTTGTTDEIRTLPLITGKAGQLPPITTTSTDIDNTDIATDTGAVTTPQDDEDAEMAEVRLNAKIAMQANEKRALSRAERTNKKLSKAEARELVQELAMKRGERQLKSVLGRQKGIAHLANQESTELGGEGSLGNVNKTVDIDENRALRLEKMRRKQVFVYDDGKRNDSNIDFNGNAAAAPNNNNNDTTNNNNEDDDEEKNDDADNQDELNEDITGKKASRFYEKYKAVKKNKYAQKSKYSSATRKEWKAKFNKSSEEKVSDIRPDWMNMSRDKKLITAIIRSHHSYIKARDDQELRCMECCCCCTCMCCMRKDDLPDQYEDKRFTINDLIQAVDDQDIYSMLDLIYHPNYPVSVNEVDKNGESPLYRFLTETMQNSFENIEADDGDALIFKPSPFWMPRKMRKKAVKMRGKKEWVIKILLYAGADINFISHTKAFEAGSLLHFAVEKNLYAYAQWLVEDRKCIVNTYTTMLNRTPLMISCLMNRAELTMFLLRHGGIVVLNEQDTRGWSALHFAAAFSDDITVKALLIAGADKFARNNMGRVPVDEGLSRGKHENVNLILTHNAFDPIKEDIDRLNHLKKYHDSSIATATKEATYRMHTNMTIE